MHITRTARIPAVTVLIALGVLALGACGGGTGADRVATVTTTSTVAPPTTTAVDVNDDADDAVVEDATGTEMTPSPGLVATATADLAVYAAIGDAAPMMTLPAHTSFGSPTTLLARARNDEWLDVALPVRPNGSHGFVRADAVTLTTVDVAIDIDLGARRLQLRGHDGTVMLETPVAIGSSDNPTPFGDFYVTDLLDTGNSGSAYGPFAFGLSGHSETLSEFGGGDGQVGIHGTNQPSSIGQAVSHGCVRVPNDVVVQLAHSLPLGTPVSIH